MPDLIPNPVYFQIHPTMVVCVKGPSVSTSAVSRQPSRGMLSMVSKKDEEAARQLSNMARAARKVGPNDRVVELRKVRT